MSRSLRPWPTANRGIPSSTHRLAPLPVTFPAAPYLYVGPWAKGELRPDPFWNEPFGASLSYADLVDAADQRGVALAFFRRARDRLTAAS